MLREPVRILVAESTGFSPIAAQLLRTAGSLELADLNRSELLGRLPGAHVLWVRLRHRIDAELLDRAHGLRVLATPTTGHTHLDEVALGARGITIVSLRGERPFLDEVRATAEHTVALLLAVTRHLPRAIAHVREGGWDRNLFVGSELYRKVIGVIGYGRLGRRVALYLQAFGAEVLVSDPAATSESVDSGITLVSLERLLAESDIVSVHVSYEAGQAPLLGRAELQAMKRGATLINTSRGEVLDESALLDALLVGRLGGAALDVLAGEPPSATPLHELIRYSQTHPNLIITPHIGGCTSESMEKTEVFLAQKVVATLG